MSKRFFEYSFRFLFILFWIIIWYKWVVLSNTHIEILLISIFIPVSILYIILFYIFYKKQNEKKITLYYRTSVLISFIFSLISFVLLPTSLIFLNIKSIFIIVCIYTSYKMLFKYKIEEGLVGIISSVLLLVITFLY